MPHRLCFTSPIMDIDWNVQWPNDEFNPVVYSSELDLNAFALQPQLELIDPESLLPPFLFDDQHRSYGDCPQVLDDSLTVLRPSSAVSMPVAPHPLLDSVPSMLEASGDSMVGKRIHCKPAKRFLKERSKGRRSRFDSVNASTKSDSSGRASIRQRKLSLQITTMALASKRNASTLTDEEGEEEGDQDGGDGGGHHFARHNQIEKNYRNRLNVGFARLLAAVETTAPNKGEGVGGENGARTLSKGNVLGLASRRLLALEARNQLLGSEVQRLRGLFHD